MQNDQFHWCSFTGQQDLPIAAASSGAYPAVLPRDVNLWNKPEITVAFTYETTQLLAKWKLDVDDILEGANQWHQLQEEPNYIPKFKSIQSVKRADIIVELNGNRDKNYAIHGMAIILLSCLV